MHRLSFVAVPHSLVIFSDKPDLRMQQGTTDD